MGRGASSGFHLERLDGCRFQRQHQFWRNHRPYKTRRLWFLWKRKKTLLVDPQSSMVLEARKLVGAGDSVRLPIGLRVGFFAECDCKERPPGRRARPPVG